ncbi:MAG: hypothetical protein HQL72_00555 [Magnetococcales bacterium]|nr:hypothetical protein [Magnetococcales bacterium]
MADHHFDIAVHHVGGRSGTTSLKKIPSFVEHNMVRVLYDADERCIDQIKDNCEKMYSRYVVLPFCLSDREGEEPLFLKPDRYESSLFAPDAETSPRFEENRQFGWDLDLHGVDAVHQVGVTTLDSLLIDNPSLSHVPLPDYLSLDVESAEPKILSGGSTLLKRKCLVVQCEFDLEETFPALNTLFKRFDFEISDVQMFPDVFQHTRQIPLGLRFSGKRCAKQGEITVFKSPAAIVAHHDDPLTDLSKGAILSLVLFDLEKCYGYLDQLMTLPDWEAFLTDNQKVPYIKILSYLISSIESYPAIPQMKFSHLFPSVDSRTNRFYIDGKGDGDDDSQELPSEESRTPADRYFSEVDKKQFYQSIDHLLTEEEIGVELLLRSVGMEEHAELFQASRVEGIEKLLRWLGLEKKAREDVDGVSAQQLPTGEGKGGT